MKPECFGQYEIGPEEETRGCESCTEMNNCLDCTIGKLAYQRDILSAKIQSIRINRLQELNR